MLAFTSHDVRGKRVLSSPSWINTSQSALQYDDDADDHHLSNSDNDEDGIADQVLSIIESFVMLMI